MLTPSGAPERVDYCPDSGQPVHLHTPVYVLQAFRSHPLDTSWIISIEAAWHRKLSSTIKTLELSQTFCVHLYLRVSFMPLFLSECI